MDVMSEQRIALELGWHQWSHTRPRVEKENKVDPDEGNCMECNACRLPIFSNPFTTTDRNLVMHDRCAGTLPPTLKAHPLHPSEDLVLHQEDSTTSSPSLNNTYYCSRCHLLCGTMFYKCHSDCGFRLDLACALMIKILHRSHHHRLTAVKGRSLSSLFCAVCRTQHEHSAVDSKSSETWQVSYVCNPCDFWIHPDCAHLPNAIMMDKYDPHPLLLTYRGPSGGFVDVCMICHHLYDESDVVYACFLCRYAAHVKCAVYSDPDHISFKPVLIREAKIPNLVRLPMPNEHASVMKAALTSYVGGARFGFGSKIGTITYDHQSDGSKLFENNKIHEHPLIFHEDYDGVARVCNACVQLISPSDPFYSCPCCRDFFLHRCCAHLQTTLFTAHKSLYRQHLDHPLTLISKANNRFNMFRCDGCRRQCNGFAYKCEECRDYNLDVVCAFMHTPITHDGHAKSHILQPLLGYTYNTCYCCCEIIQSEIGYKCNSCRNFKIHARCALLPDTVTHKFDRHPLKLLSATQTIIDDYHLIVVKGGDDQGKEEEEEEEEEKTKFCEICEEDLDDKCWHYGCKECDQFFHVGCIPTLDELSRIKFGFTTTAHVRCHDCPLECVRALSVDGYRCGHCDQIIRKSDQIAFECSDCYFRIHKKCAEELSVE